MEYRLVNPDKVSHINVYKEREGVRSYWGFYSKVVWKEATYFKLFWLITLPWWRTYEAGFYRDELRVGTCSTFQINKRRHYTLLGSVWTYPHIEIYCGEKEVHVEYFTSMVELESHLKQYYSNVNIKY